MSVFLRPGYSLYYDDPDITEKSKLRMDVAITVPKETPLDGEIGKSAIRGGTYAVAHFEISSNQIKDAWDAVLWRVAS